MGTLEDAKRRYRFDAWAGSNRLARDLHVHDVFIPPDRLGAVQLLRSRTQPVGRRASTSLWSGARDVGGPALRVDFVEHRDREGAHEALAAALANFESPMVLESDEAIGDIAFTAPGRRAIAFARANVTILLANLSVMPVDVTAIAAALDDWITAAPRRVTAARDLEAPTIALTRNARGSVGRVDVRVPPELETHGPAMLKLFARDGVVSSIQSGLRVRPAGAAEPQVEGYVYERTPSGAGRCVALKAAGS
ncbi:hypothetical protein ABZ477_02580 [Microbacterium sp. NPDC019599]|uniref:hypothetical protein n=1 Tax=Microbacterium sp. NPDC019599 TaxID=3154690 RepID=UPI0033E5FDB2